MRASKKKANDEGKKHNSAQQFQSFLACALCRYPCYKSLHKFICYFDRLNVLATPPVQTPAIGGAPCAGKEPAKVKMLRMIAMKIDDKTKKPCLPKAALSFENLGADLQETTDFLGCALFSDYVTVLTEHRLEEAKREKDQEKCYRILDMLAKLPSLPPSWQSQINIGMGVLDPSATAISRVRFILQNESAVDLVLSWWPNQPLGILAQMVKHPEGLKMGSLAWADFRDALQLIIASGEQESVEIQDLKDLLVVAEPLMQGGKLPEWASCILRETCGSVHGVSSWNLGDEAFAGKINTSSFVAKDKEAFGTLVKSVRKLVATEIRVNGIPAWLGELNKMKDELKKKK